MIRRTDQFGDGFIFVIATVRAFGSNPLIAFFIVHLPSHPTLQDELPGCGLS